MWGPKIRKGFVLSPAPVWRLRRAQQQAELRPRAAESQALRDTVLVLSQELDRAAAERQVLEAARERARASALRSLTEHGQVVTTGQLPSVRTCYGMHMLPASGPPHRGPVSITDIP